ncbi:hypothetical protein [Parolsenella catena]|uniref:hypothetical protein n=1 Tax=Parolsenella catena TaxID=2003188 RepID=UPI003A95D1B7
MIAAAGLYNCGILDIHAASHNDIWRRPITGHCHFARERIGKSPLSLQPFTILGGSVRIANQYESNIIGPGSTLAKTRGDVIVGNFAIILIRIGMKRKKVKYLVTHADVQSYIPVCAAQVLITLGQLGMDAPA